MITARDRNEDENSKPRKIKSDEDRVPLFYAIDENRSLPNEKDNDKIGSQINKGEYVHYTLGGR